MMKVTVKIPTDIDNSSICHAGASVAFHERRTGREKMSAVENFKSIAEEVIASAASEKARTFAEKVVGSVLARGEEWITENSGALHVGLNADQIRSSAPAADNRLFFLSKWQMALA